MTTGERIDPRELELTEKVVYINRVSKVVKGGRRFSFSALVVVGDGHGHIGAGMGKANEVPEAIRKGASIARRGLIRIPMIGTTIPHPVFARFGAARVMIKPASAGTGVIAGGGVRAVMEVAGVKDVLAKSLGSSNAINVVRATIEGLTELKNPADERRRRADAAAAPIETAIRHGRPPVVRVPRDRDNGPRRGDRRDDRPRPPFDDRQQGGGMPGGPGRPADGFRREAPTPVAPAAEPTTQDEAALTASAAATRAMDTMEQSAPVEVQNPEAAATATTAEAATETTAQTPAEQTNASTQEAAAVASEPEAAASEPVEVADEPRKRTTKAADEAAAVAEPGASQSEATSASMNPESTATTPVESPVAAEASVTAAAPAETPEAVASSGEPEGTETQPETGEAVTGATEPATPAKPRRTSKADAISSAEVESDTPVEGSI